MAEVITFASSVQRPILSNSVFFPRNTSPGGNGINIDEEKRGDAPSTPEEVSENETPRRPVSKRQSPKESGKGGINWDEKHHHSMGLGGSARWQAQRRGYSITAAPIRPRSRSLSRAIHGGSRRHTGRLYEPESEKMSRLISEAYDYGGDRNMKKSRLLQERARALAQRKTAKLQENQERARRLEKERIDELTKRQSGKLEDAAARRQKGLQTHAHRMRDLAATAEQLQMARKLEEERLLALRERLRGKFGPGGGGDWTMEELDELSRAGTVGMSVADEHPVEGKAVLIRATQRKINAFKRKEESIRRELERNSVKYHIPLPSRGAGASDDEEEEFSRRRRRPRRGEGDDESENYSSGSEESEGGTLRTGRSSSSTCRRRSQPSTARARRRSGQGLVWEFSRARATSTPSAKDGPSTSRRRRGGQMSPPDRSSMINSRKNSRGLRNRSDGDDDDEDEDEESNDGEGRVNSVHHLIRLASDQLRAPWKVGPLWNDSTPPLGGTPLSASTSGACSPPARQQYEMPSPECGMGQQTEGDSQDYLAGGFQGNGGEEGNAPKSSKQRDTSTKDAGKTSSQTKKALLSLTARKQGEKSALTQNSLTSSPSRQQGARLPTKQKMMRPASPSKTTPQFTPKVLASVGRLSPSPVKLSTPLQLKAKAAPSISPTIASSRKTTSVRTPVRNATFSVPAMTFTTPSSVLHQRSHPLRGSTKTGTSPLRTNTSSLRATKVAPPSRVPLSRITDNPHPSAQTPQDVNLASQQQPQVEVPPASAFVAPSRQTSDQGVGDPILTREMGTLTAPLEDIALVNDPTPSPSYSLGTEQAGSIHYDPPELGPAAQREIALQVQFQQLQDQQERRQKSIEPWVDAWGWQGYAVQQQDPQYAIAWAERMSGQNSPKSAPSPSSSLKEPTRCTFNDEQRPSPSAPSTPAPSEGDTFLLPHPDGESCNMTNDDATSVEEKVLPVTCGFEKDNCFTSDVGQKENLQGSKMTSVDKATSQTCWEAKGRIQLRRFPQSPPVWPPDIPRKAREKSTAQHSIASPQREGNKAISVKEHLRSASSTGKATKQGGQHRSPRRQRKAPRQQHCFMLDTLPPLAALLAMTFPLPDAESTLMDLEASSLALNISGGSRIEDLAAATSFPSCLVATTSFPLSPFPGSGVAKGGGSMPGMPSPLSDATAFSPSPDIDDVSNAEGLPGFSNEIVSRHSKTLAETHSYGGLHIYPRMKEAEESTNLSRSGLSPDLFGPYATLWRGPTILSPTIEDTNTLTYGASGEHHTSSTPILPTLAAYATICPMQPTMSGRCFQHIE